MAKREQSQIAELEGTLKQILVNGESIDDNKKFVRKVLAKVVMEHREVLNAPASAFVSLAAKVIGQTTWEKLDNLPPEVDINRAYTEALTENVFFDISPFDSATKLLALSGAAGGGSYQKRFNPMNAYGSAPGGAGVGTFFESLFLNRRPSGDPMPDLSGLQEDMVNYFKHAALEVKTSAIGEVEMPIGGFVSQGWVLTESENLKKLLATPIDELFARIIGALKVLEKMAAVLIISVKYAEPDSPKWTKFQFGAVMIFSRLNLKTLLGEFKPGKTGETGLFYVRPDVKVSLSENQLKEEGSGRTDLGFVKLAIGFNLEDFKTEGGQSAKAINAIYQSQADFLTTPMGKWAWSEALIHIDRSFVPIKDKQGNITDNWLWNRTT
jgi:hypothetical protein